MKTEGDNMGTTEYETGRIYSGIDIESGERVTIMRCPRLWVHMTSDHRLASRGDAEITDVEGPLVTLNLAEAPRDVVNVAASVDMARTLRLYADKQLDWLAGQIEAQVKPPRPDEPTGLGAVVDGVSQTWVRVRHSDQPWRGCANGLHYNWADIKDPVVKHAGWSE